MTNAQARRGPERQPRIDLAQQAAQRRSQDEAGAEGNPDLAEHRSALLRCSDVGDIGEHGGDAGRGDARDRPPDEQPDQVRRQRHQHVVRGKAEIRQQDHRPAAKAIGQRAQDRRADELHQGPDRAEHAEDACRVGGVIADEALDQLGQDRDDDPEREHVEQQGDEDEDHRAAARLRKSRRGILVLTRFLHANRYPLRSKTLCPLTTAACACGRTDWPSRAA
ncbi:hypothetical protein ACVISU_000767 [Bradyrhizobium sp. USDA 4452]